MDTIEVECTEEELGARAERKARRNTERFREIADLIEQYPERHNQSFWSSGIIGETEFDLPESGEVHAVCGTTQCIAGWAVALDDKFTMRSVGKDISTDPVPVVNIETGEPFNGWTAEGRDILGLNSYEAQMLFHFYGRPVMGWPRALRALAEGVDVERALREDVPNCGCETGVDE